MTILNLLRPNFISACRFTVAVACLYLTINMVKWQFHKPINTHAIFSIEHFGWQELTNFTLQNVTSKWNLPWCRSSICFERLKLTNSTLSPPHDVGLLFWVKQKRLATSNGSKLEDTSADLSQASCWPEKKKRFQHGSISENKQLNYFISSLIRGQRNKSRLQQPSHH